MGTRHKGTPEEVAALDAYIKLSRALESVNVAVHTEMPSDLTVTQFGVLEALYHAGPLCHGALAAKVLKSAGNLTLVVDNLEKAGLVARIRSTGDRRFISVDLTPEGRKLIASVCPIVIERIRKEMSALTIEEQATLGALCKKLGLRNAPVALGAENSTPPPSIP